MPSPTLSGLENVGNKQWQVVARKTAATSPIDADILHHRHMHHQMPSATSTSRQAPSKMKMNVSRQSAPRRPGRASQNRKLSASSTTQSPPPRNGGSRRHDPVEIVDRSKSPKPTEQDDCLYRPFNEGCAALPEAGQSVVGARDGSGEPGSTGRRCRRGGRSPQGEVEIGVGGGFRRPVLSGWHRRRVRRSMPDRRAAISQSPQEPDQGERAPVRH